MAPPNNDNFRHDSEFVKMIAKQSEHGIILDILNTRMDKGFSNINDKLETLSKTLVHSQESCKNYSPPNKRSKSTFIDVINPHILKTIVIIIVFVIAYILGIDVKY